MYNNRYFITILFLITLIPWLEAQESIPWMRYPAISPDGQTIVFGYQGDIWLVATEGGNATRLTTHSAYDSHPVWSGDGLHIAFASNRHGNFDVFMIAVNNGTSQRLTFHSADDWPTDFDAANQRVYFNSIRRDNSESLLFHRLGELYSISTNGGAPKLELSIPAWNAQLDGDGNVLFEEIKGYEDQFRKHHTSSVTRDVWVRKVSDGAYQKLSSFEGENRNPVYGTDGSFFFLSEESGTFNVHKSSLSNPGSNVQISNFTLHPVRYLSISDEGVLCYSFNGSIYTQREGESPTLVDIQASGDVSILPEKQLSVSGGISEMDISSNDKEIAFIYRGEVFVTTVEGDITRRLTFTPEQERSLQFSPDGKSLVFAGERNNSWNLYMIKLGENDSYFSNALDLKEEVLLATTAETFQPRFSPDGKKIAFLEERTRLKTIDVETKAVVQITDGTQTFSYADGDQHFSWSPDGKWFTLTFDPEAHWVSETGIIKSDGTGSIINLTKSGFYDEYPQWSRDGKMIYWFSDRHGGHSVAKSGGFQMDVYAYFLTQEAFDDYKLSKAELAIQPEEEEETEEAEDDDKKKKKKGKDEDAEEDKEDELPEVKIEFDGLAKRKARLSLFSSYLSDAKLDGESKALFYLGSTEDKAELWKTDLRTRETKSLGSYGWGSLLFNKDGSSLYVASYQGITKVDPESGKGKSISINGDMLFDQNEERLYLFDHASRQVRKKFLDPNLHGADWDLMTSNYRAFVPGLNNDFDFRDVLGELLGELNASHTGARWWTRHDNPDRTGALGVFYDDSFEGPGLRIKEIMDDSPLIFKDKKIKTGVIIESIDGTTLSATTNPNQLLNQTPGKSIIVAFYDPVSGERWKEWVKPISIGAENELYYQRWIKRNRALVHELSDKQIGYMHVRNMSDRSFREFLEDAMGEEVNKKALIVDTRFNGGGDLVDDLTTWLSGKRYMEFESNEGRVIGQESMRRWTKPSVMLVGESNYSDAHCTPAAYKDLEIGKLIGMPVPGTCSFVWWERMQNGMVFGIPNMWVKDIVGDVLENKQLEPDIQVKNPFEEITMGRDRQIEVAVEELLKGID